MARNPSQKGPAPRRESGARTARTSLRDRLTAWRLHHRDSARDAWQRMVAAPVGTAMTVLVIAIALALPAGISVLLENARALTRDWDGNVHLSVFLNEDIGESEQRDIAEQWNARDDVARTSVITREDALREFRELSGFGEVLEALPDNPLPPVIMVYPVDTGPAALERLRVWLDGRDTVDIAQLDVEWVQRLHAMLEVGERIVGALTLALALAVLLVMVNTIRLAIENRRDEIRVIKTVGGTDSFVRRPFLYTGFWHGLAGGILAVLLVQIALLWLGGAVDNLMTLYESDYSLTGLPWTMLFILPLFAGLLGLLGAWLAVGRHLREMDPDFL